MKRYARDTHVVGEGILTHDRRPDPVHQQPAPAGVETRG